LYQIVEVRHIASSQNNIALNSAFFSDTNIGIIEVIENNQPVLKENGGPYTTAQLDNYLGYFETINQAYSEGLLTEDQLCTSFSDHAITASKNKEVQEYMKNYSNYFDGFSELMIAIAKSTNSDCHDDPK
jgi:hypothetical protein